MDNFNIRHSDNFDSDDDDDMFNDIMNPTKVSRPSSPKSTLVSNSDKNFVRQERQERQQDFNNDMFQNPKNITIKRLDDFDSVSSAGSDGSSAFKPKMSSKQDEGSFRDDASEVSSYAGSEMDEEEVMEKKRYYLRKIASLKAKGVDSAIEVSLRTSLKELQVEYMSMKKSYDVGKCIPMMRTGLMTICGGAESLNTYMQTPAKLEGWSAAVQEAVEADEADDILEELYEKHYDKLTGWSPEVRLGYFLGNIALQQHVINSMGTKISDMANGDPVLAAKLAETTRQHASTYQPQLMQQVNQQMGQMTNGMMGVPQQPVPQPIRNMNGPSTDDAMLRELGIDLDNDDIVFE